MGGERFRGLTLLRNHAVSPEQSKRGAMFAVNFGIWIKCKDGELDYERSAQMESSRASAHRPKSDLTGMGLVCVAHTDVSGGDAVKGMAFP
jgi:hypothetical protein